MEKQYKVVELPDGTSAIAAKMDSDGNPMPIIFNPEQEGSDEPVDALGMLYREMPKLRNEAKSKREHAAQLEEQLKPFIIGETEDKKPKFLDIKAAKEAMEVQKQVDAGKLIEAGKKDDVIKTMTEEFHAKEQALRTTFAEKEAEYLSAVSQTSGKYKDYRIQSAFAQSKVGGFLEKTNLGPEVASQVLGNYFDLDDNDRIIAKVNGEPLYSTEKAGELADFEEALQTVWSKWPEGRQYLKGSKPAGSGQPGTPGHGSSTNMSRHDRYKSGLKSIGAV